MILNTFQKRHQNHMVHRLILLVMNVLLFYAHLVSVFESYDHFLDI